jgi:hypothetical protein
MLLHHYKHTTLRLLKTIKILYTILSGKLMEKQIKLMAQELTIPIQVLSFFLNLIGRRLSDKNPLTELLSFLYQRKIYLILLKFIPAMIGYKISR